MHQLSDCNVTSAKPNPQEFVLVTEVPSPNWQATANKQPPTCYQAMT